MSTSTTVRTLTIAVITTFFNIPSNLHAQANDLPTDPCLFAQKSSAVFNITTGGFQSVIKGTNDTHIVVCELVFSGSASQGFNISFAGIPSNGSAGFTLLGILWPSNNAVVVAGSGGSTQFATTKDEDFSIELGGNTPLQANGWVTYVQVRR